MAIAMAMAMACPVLNPGHVRRRQVPGVPSCPEICRPVQGLRGEGKAGSRTHTDKRCRRVGSASKLIGELREAEGELRVAHGKLAEKEGKLAKVGADLGECQARLDGAKRTQRDLQDDADRCKKRFDAANGLIEALSGERDRWTMQRSQ